MLNINAILAAVIDNSHSNLYCFCSPISFSGCLQAKLERYEPAIAEFFGLVGSLNTSCKKKTKNIDILSPLKLNFANNCLLTRPTILSII